MVTPPELAVLGVILVALLVAYTLVKAVKPFIVNAVLGLVVILLAGFFGFGVNITWVVVLVVAIGGIPGALLVIILAQVGLVFDPALLAPLL
ncbi:Membrane protein, BofA family [Halanaeroarchaeum sp. HSR-CO]|uniref:pro-sigmaK processing inhibitor BofA family protein n=1 Tax=Halanaeroarchaeum sp. HSR-CO TaxID=2866382 RepID=UPI00217E617D|nr:pro-sigmaK processing inhibitor BofA family protein [Halanaeroarchaeum sp. HSR-CO]UWG46519.1 Membrane protein, BofA family [Halanaeroarchaeum sp. HSR-CO]